MTENTNDDKYDRLGLIGAGGFGEVSLVREKLTGAFFALKTIGQSGLQEREGLQRYRNNRDIRINPHLIQVYEIGGTPDGFYYTMELADNLETADIATRYTPDTLASRISNADGGRLRYDEIVWCLFRLLNGLKALHGAGFAHCDIKPANIIFVNGEPKLADVGLVAARQGLASAGTPGYVRPEAGESPVTAQGSDLYALGMVILNMLGIRDLAAPLPELSADEKRMRDFSYAVCNPAAKPVRSVGEFQRELERCGITDTPEVVKVGRSRGWRVAGVAALVILLVGLILAAGQYFRVIRILPDNRQLAAFDAQFPNERKSEPGTRIYSYFSPDGGSEKAILREIAKTVKSIRVSVYFFTEKDFAEALVAAKKRGATVEVVVDKTQENRRDSMVPLLVENGIPVYIDEKHRIMHDKFAVIDGDTVVTGSQNWTDSSEKKNAENTLIIRNNRHLAQKYSETFEQLKNMARKVIPAKKEAKLIFTEPSE